MSRIHRRSDRTARRHPCTPLALALLVALAGCGGDDGRAAGEASTTPGAGPPEDLEWSGGWEPGDPAAGEQDNLVFEPLELPEADYAAAAREAEPNDDTASASPLGADLTARGTLEGRESDYFVFTTEGEPGLWAVEARGDGLAYLEYRDPSGARTTRGDAEEGVAELPNLYLPPGRHILLVRGDSLEYALRAVSLGAPDPRAEREPNDDASRAQVLDVGRSRVGYLHASADADVYRFSLRSPEHLRLMAEPPAGLSLMVDLEDGGGRIVLLRAEEPGDTLRYSMLLPPGDYHLRLRPDDGTASRLPYRLRLEPLDPFAPDVDAEPNDEARWARPLPATMEVRGEVGAWEDREDWYRLPRQEEEARVALRPVLLPEGRQLRQLVTLRREERRGTGPLALEHRPDSTLAGTVPAGTQAYLRVRGEGRYAFAVELAPGPEPRPEPGPGAVELALPTDPRPFAAFWPDAQRGEVPLRLENTSDQAARVTLEAVTSDVTWRARPPAEAMELGPGEVRTVSVPVDVEADAWGGRPVRLVVRGEDGQGGWRTATTELQARCEAPPVGPAPAAPLPTALLGGVNVAWSALGARPASSDDRRADRESVLLDGLIPAGQHWYASTDDLPWDLDVELAGDEPVRVAGVVVNPGGPERAWEGVRDFELWLSQDGARYQRALGGALTRHVMDQPFVLPEPVAARFARVRVLGGHGDEANVYLSSLAVVAEPGSTALEGRGANIAAPEVGGHVVWSDPLLADRSEPELLTEAGEGRSVRLDPLRPNEWVVGFHHERAARIRRIEWVQPSRDDRLFLDGAEVAVSMAGPVGPWTALGRLTVEPRAEAVGRLDLPDGPWARYVKLTVLDPPEGRSAFTPETLRIFEQPTDGAYRSVLGEWGRYRRAAVFERLAWTPPALRHDPDMGTDDERAGAGALEPDEPVAGAVRVGEDVDWYRIQVPRNDNRLRLDLRGIPALRAQLRVEDEAGTAVPLERVEEGDPGARVIYEATVPGGRPFFVRVEEPPRSIVLVWDNSGSVTPFHPTLYPSLLRFTADVQPGREVVRLLPFSDGRFLLPGWSDRPHELQAALASYPRRDGSSNAELDLIHAVDALRARQGTRAIVVLTDADSDGYRLSPLLWAGLRDVRPSIFSVELHRGSDAAHQQDVLQGWAAVAGGGYDFFRTGADLDVAFRRASCLIRRPARYELTASTRHEAPPLPGFVAVDPEALALNAVELILDASGSMLQRMEGRRRIEIARDVLSELVTTTIPEGTPLALRVFGHRTPDACDTDLEVPLQPLDPERVRTVIQQTQAMNLARTPIGASLGLVADDLGEVEGQKLIMLITDGEETCDGDPAAEIRELKEAGHDIRVNIVGFAIDDEGLKAEFERWAREGGGLYLDAASREELARAVDRALRPKFQIVGAVGEVLGEGTAGLDALEVPVGEYTVRVLTSPVRSVRGVRVESQDTTRVRPGPGQED